MTTTRNLKAVGVERKYEANSLLKDNFKYVPADKTDIRITFKKYGFVPPTKYRTDFLFEVNRMEKGV